MEDKELNEQLDVLLKDVDEDVRALLKNRDKLLRKKPFTRGGAIKAQGRQTKVGPGGTVAARLPGMQRNVVTQDQYWAELDPYMHDVLFDDNIPAVCVKTTENGTYDVKMAKIAFPFQRIIMEKQTLHMSCLPMSFTLAEQKPTEAMQSDFVRFKHYWDLRNQDGMKVKMVAAAKSFGDAGLLYYLDRHGEVKSRLISYEDGYVICSHNDANGDRMLETVYYMSDGDEYIDSWDDKNMYRWSSSESGDWTLTVEPHGFGEIPLVTKRTRVAWDNGQTEIDGYERAANIDNVIDSKWGWGLLYVKGRIDPNAKKIAGNIVLNDTSIDPSKSDAKFLDPPSAKNANEKFEMRFKQIQIATGTTFILPQDIHTSSDTSGVAVEMTQSLDIQTAENGIVEWQNVVDKMVRLFKRGLAMELVDKAKRGLLEGKADAITEFDKMFINATMLIWKPRSTVEFNQMLGTMKSMGILSRRTSVEANTVSRPDEVERIEKEEQESMEREMEKARRDKELEAQYSAADSAKGAE